MLNIEFQCSVLSKNPSHDMLLKYNIETLSVKYIHQEKAMYSQDVQGHEKYPGGTIPIIPVPPANLYSSFMFTTSQVSSSSLHWSSGLCHCCDDPANCKKMHACLSSNSHLIYLNNWFLCGLYLFP